MYFFTSYQHENATDPRWERFSIEDLTNRDVTEIEAIAEEEQVSFDTAFDLWLESKNDIDYDYDDWS